MTGRLGALVAVGAIAVLVWVPAAASAHANRPMPGESPSPVPEGERDGSALTLVLPKEARLGGPVTFRARLTSDEGEPVADAVIVFEQETSWGEEFAGEMAIGTARTGPDGWATFTTSLRRSGEGTIHAHFEGDATYVPAEADGTLMVVGDTQLYTPRTGIEVPGIGPWLLGAVVATVWFMFFLVAVRIRRIARPTTAASTEAEAVVARGLGRRQFLGRVALPVGLQTLFLSVGSGLVALIARSPHTHNNTASAVADLQYHRTPFATVGQHAEMREMPPLLAREVSFLKDVHPILLARGGPHVIPLGASPPPAGIRFDSYAHLLAKREEGEEPLVVPGKPEESMLVSVLLDPAMQMPPSLPALPDEEIQVIASWVAQGAKDN